MASIALSLSGGGFRAATYHLGLLSYLNRLQAADGRSLLAHVNTLSTISGGSLTGLWMILCQSQGKDDSLMLRQLHDLLLHGDLIGRASREFLCGESTNHSLIREMVKIYDEEIFHGATLGDLMDKIDTISLEDFSANATEFNNAIEFRFQVSRKRTTAGGGTSRGVIGNSKYQLSEAVARQILLAEVFAASSCFPGGFEPLFFPRDFRLNDNPANAEYLSGKEPVALMDGGVVDNQGIEPVNLIRKRKDIDLFIISDAGRGRDINYRYDDKDICSHLSVHKVNVILNLLVLFFAQFLLWVPRGFWFGFWLSLTLLFLGLRLSTALISRSIIKRYARLVPFSFQWEGLLNIPFSKYVNLFLSRATSMYALTQNVFMKHIRALNYATIYENPQWQNRSIMNGLYELGTGENFGKHLTAEEEVLMAPSAAINATTDLAASMNTTLWWSDDDRRQRKPEALIACGQYTICWNLLEYIYRLRRNDENTNEHHDLISALQPQLEADWQRFKDDPYWMLEEDSSLSTAHAE